MLTFRSSSYNFGEPFRAKNMESARSKVAAHVAKGVNSRSWSVLSEERSPTSITQHLKCYTRLGGMGSFERHFTVEVINAAS